MEEYEKGYIAKCIPSCYPKYNNLNVPSISIFAPSGRNGSKG